MSCDMFIIVNSECARDVHAFIMCLVLKFSVA
jgi:hypothetical protein